MTGPSLAKDFHRLMKRIGRLTDGQASIDDVDWEGGNLNSFKVTIRPNASFYKDGRFKFTVTIPDTFTSGDPPLVWCETDIYHPNIDRHESRVDGATTNVCLNMFQGGTWNKSYGLEGVVLGILFLMHNPNLEDPLSPEFDSDYPDVDDFALNVKAYMAGEEVDDNEYSIDFRVIDGVFKDMTIIENNDVTGTDKCSADNAECTDDAVVAETAATEVETSNESNTTRDDTQDMTVEINNNMNSADTSTIEANKITETATPDDSVVDEEEITPVRFVNDAEGDGYFVLHFGDTTDETDNKPFSCDKNATTVPSANEEPKCETNDEVSTGLLGENNGMSKSVTNLTELIPDRIMSRSVSVPNDFYARSINKHKPPEEQPTHRLVALACVALDCILTVYKNVL